jgi:putative transposase
MSWSTLVSVVVVDTDGGGVRRAYKFRLRPTARQHVALGQCLASHRELYNAALQERKDAWRLKRTAVFYGDQSAQLKEIRTVRPDVGVWSFSSQQATLRRLNRAFAGFFRRVRAGQRPGYPRFKSARRFDTVEWPKDGDGCRWQPNVRRVYLQGIGQVKVTVHRQVQGRVKTIQVCRDGRRWMLILSCDQVPTRPLEPTRAAVGIDVGIASFATTSDGQQVPNPGLGQVAAAKLGTAQQVLARKQRDSNNRQRAIETLAARHRKLANQRRNFHHHAARALVARYDLLVVEDLRIRNMVRRPAPRPDPDQPGGFLPNRAAVKSGLHRSIHDAGWAQFVSILRAKAEEAGRVVIVVDARHTSDRCEACGHTATENRVSQAVFSCRGCGHTVDADEHAARNILRAGLARLAANPAAWEEAGSSKRRRSHIIGPVAITDEWRGAFASAEANALHAECFDHQVLGDDE